MTGRKSFLRNTLVALLFALPAAFLLPRHHNLVPAEYESLTPAGVVILRVADLSGLRQE